MTAKIDGTNGVIQQYAYLAPTTGFSYTFPAGTTVLVMQPADTLATGTITMPAAPVDGMTISFSSTQAITALTVAGNTGQSIVGGSSVLFAGGACTFVYRLSNTTWYAQINTSASGGTPVTTIYTAPATWTKPATVKSVKVTVVSAGGGGGGVSAEGPGNYAGGGGGGAGGTAYMSAPQIPGPVAITASSTGGAGGLNGLTGPGGTGGTGSSSSFGNFVTATGGAGGVNNILGAGGGATGAFTVGPGISGVGSSGAPGATGYSNPGSINVGTPGGNGWITLGFGGSGAGPSPGASAGKRPGAAGSGYSAGGGGASASGGPAPAITGPATGGAGSGGYVIVEEFY